MIGIVFNGRNLQPHNLEQEVILNFNLPPFNVLHSSGFIQEIVELWRSKKSRFHQTSAVKGFHISELSSFFANFCWREEMKSYIPVALLSQSTSNDKCVFYVNLASLVSKIRLLTFQKSENDLKNI